MDFNYWQLNCKRNEVNPEDKSSEITAENPEPEQDDDE